jgi:GNAT superfamily N-acetyltransferase
MDIDVFSSYLKKDKFKNKIQELNLSQCTDEQGLYICLQSIVIKKSQRNKGYGSAVLSEIIKYAEIHNVRIILHVTNAHGLELKKLYGFYGKHNFFLIKNDKEGKMIYKPKKVNSHCNLLIA